MQHSEELGCPRCRQLASGTARRRGRCTACGATLVVAVALKETVACSYLFGPPLPAPRGIAAGR
ncbi:MAG TPA: hypothetical protein VG518_05855 [Solirubrobacterales bacterium]|nr:hypothetical protein [Solirubrobacterales bacterium]